MVGAEPLGGPFSAHLDIRAVLRGAARDRDVVAAGDERGIVPNNDGLVPLAGGKR